MNFTKLLPNIQSEIYALLNKYPLIEPIVKSIIQQNGKAFLVGGAVRDIILNLPVHDLDIEVHNLTFDQLKNILSNYSPVSLVGKSFGVLKIHGLEIDWSLPRTDSAGRKPKVTIDPKLDIKEALKRRDVTMNAMAIDLNCYELIDPFNGYEDMQSKILRSPDINFFTQDPLRFYRVMQFISRFEMFPDNELNQMCQHMNISNISIERIEMEFKKLMLKSNRPSLGIRWIQSLGRLKEILPELEATVSVLQNPEWHPEGNVFEHLMQAMDAAAALEYKDNHEKLIILFSTLCHDLGKVGTTVWVDDRWRSPGHAQAGVPLARALLKRITRQVNLIDTVKVLVKYHMEPMNFIKLNSSLTAYKRLALKLAKHDANIHMLSLLCLADQRGRNGKGHLPLTGPITLVEEFVNQACKAQVFNKPEEPLLQGRDIIDMVPPGPLMGKLLKYAYQLQIKRNIKSKELLKPMVLKFLKSQV